MFQEIKLNDYFFTSAPFFAGTKSPLTTNQQTSLSSGWILPVSTTRKNNQMELTTTSLYQYVNIRRDHPLQVKEERD